MVCCLSPSHAFVHWVVIFQYVLMPYIDICEDHAMSVPKLLLSLLIDGHLFKKTWTWDMIAQLGSLMAQNFSMIIFLGASCHGRILA
jgi:hypothetical protein